MMNYTRFVNIVRISSELYSNCAAIMTRMENEFVAKSWFDNLNSMGISDEEYLNHVRTYALKNIFFPEVCNTVEALRGGLKHQTVENINAHIWLKIEKAIRDYGQANPEAAREALGPVIWDAIHQVTNWFELTDFPDKKSLSYQLNILRQATMSIFATKPIEVLLAAIPERLLPASVLHQRVEGKKLQAIEERKRIAIEGKVEAPQKKSMLADIISQLKVKTAPTT